MNLETSYFYGPFLFHIALNSITLFLWNKVFYSFHVDSRHIARGKPQFCGYYCFTESGEYFSRLSWFCLFWLRVFKFWEICLKRNLISQFLGSMFQGAVSIFRVTSLWYLSLIKQLLVIWNPLSPLLKMQVTPLYPMFPLVF